MNNALLLKNLSLIKMVMDHILGDQMDIINFVPLIDFKKQK